MRIKGKPKRYTALSILKSTSTNTQGSINPWIPLWWSAAFPGFGYFLLGNNLTAYILVTFEFIVNNMAHINEAIYKSMIGDYLGAEKALDLRWFFGYIGVYVFSMNDTYRRAVEQNKLYLLSYRYTKITSASSLSTLNINHFDISSPALSLFWSLITPGIGAVIVTRLQTFLFLLIWWGVTTVQSHWLEAVYYTALGDFDRAKKVIDPQWLLFIPSIIGFAVYFSYEDAIKGNKVFKLSQAQYFKEEYQSGDFIKPV